MISRKLRNRIGLFAAGFIALSTIGLALVGINQSGTWPSTWPTSLDHLRTNALTYDVATGCQEVVHEIHFENREEFEKAWPVILSLKTPEAPVRLNSVTTGQSFTPWTNDKPVVRIYTPQSGDSVTGESGKVLTITPETFDSIKSGTGALPEYVSIKEGLSGWEFKPTTVKNNTGGFLYRARTEIELVVDGGVIDLNRVHLPENSPIIDKRGLASAKVDH